MSIEVAALVASLQEDVPAQGGVPSADQYERAVKDAISDFGRRAGRMKRATLNIVAGTAAYDLAADFISLVNLVGLCGHGGVILSPEGIIPLSENFHEEYIVTGQRITFYPTPTYTLAREYRYKAGWAIGLDDYGEFYADLTWDEAGIALKYAAALAVGKKANASAGGFSYRQGDVSVDTSNTAATLKTQAEALKADYMAAVEQYVGTVLVRGITPIPAFPQIARAAI